jgi:hypothetical protein
MKISLASMTGLRNPYKVFHSYMMLVLAASVKNIPLWLWNFPEAPIVGIYLILSADKDSK